MNLFPTINHHRSLLLTTCLLTGLVLIAAAIPASAADQEPAKRHSLIHRQDPNATASASGSPDTTSPAPTVTTPHPLHRKLAKRPGLATITAPSAGSSQTNAPVLQSPSTLPTTQAGSGRRISMTGITLSSESSTPSTTATSLTSASVGSIGVSAPLAGATLSTVKPSASSALAGIGIGTAVPSGGSTSGRSLQRLTEQLPGLTQLLVPTTSVSSPPPPSPPGTGSAMLSWTLNSESDLAGYKIYVGTASGLYNYPGSPITIGRANGYAIAGLPYGQTYHFAISAYNSSGAESTLSGEVSKSIY